MNSAGTLGILIFCLIKIIGNSLVLMILFRNTPMQKALGAGLAKTALGAVAGISALSILGMLTGHTNSYAFYLIVIFLRTIEWAFVLHGFYPEQYALKKVKFVSIATASSSLLDIFAITGMISKTGLIC